MGATGSLSGVIHVDMKELVLSIANFRYVVFEIDEYSHYVFVEFIKRKSEADAAVARIVAAFEATVGTPVDEHGRALPRPRVRHVHSDHEGKLVSSSFKAFCARESIHHTLSPPHGSRERRSYAWYSLSTCVRQEAKEHHALVC